MLLSAWYLRAVHFPRPPGYFAPNVAAQLGDKLRPRNGMGCSTLVVGQAVAGFSMSSVEIVRLFRFRRD